MPRCLQGVEEFGRRTPSGTHDQPATSPWPATQVPVARGSIDTGEPFTDNLSDGPTGCSLNVDGPDSALRSVSDQPATIESRTPSRMSIHSIHPRRVLPIGAMFLVSIGLVGCSQNGTGVAASDSSVNGSSAQPSTTTPTSLGPTTTLDATPPTLAPFLATLPQRVYVPNGQSDTVSVIDPATHKVVKTFKTSKEPQHIVPSYDLRILWVLDNAGNDLIPIDPITSKPGVPVPVEDPYNLYFTPDGADAIVVAEARKRLDFRDPQTMALKRSLSVPDCGGVNHIDFPADSSYLIATCEFSGRLAKIDFRNGAILGMLDVPADPVDGMAAMPQDIRMGPD